MRNDDEELRQILEWLGMQLLMTDTNEKIKITYPMAAKIVAFLSASRAGKAGRPKEWKDETQIRAVFDMLNGAEVNELAREIAKETGQNARSADRRLRALKKTPRFKNWIAGKR